MTGTVLFIALCAVGVAAVIWLLRHQIWPPAQLQAEPQLNAFDRQLSHWQRAVMATFVANVTDYGSNAWYFRGLRRTISVNPEYFWLITAIERVRSAHNLPLLCDVTNDDRDRLVLLLQDDYRFLAASTRYAEYLSYLVDQCYIVTAPDGTAIPEMYIPKRPVVDAYLDARDSMLPPTGYAQ